MRTRRCQGRRGRGVLLFFEVFFPGGMSFKSMEKRGGGRIPGSRAERAGVCGAAGREGGRDGRSSSGFFCHLLSSWKNITAPLKSGILGSQLPSRSGGGFRSPPAARMLQPRGGFILGRSGKRTRMPQIPPRPGLPEALQPPLPAWGPFPGSWRVAGDPGGIGMIPKPPRARHGHKARAGG